MDEDLLMTEASIVVIAHAVTMSAGIMNDDEVAHFDFRKLSLNLSQFSQREPVTS